MCQQLPCAMQLGNDAARCALLTDVTGSVLLTNLLEFAKFTKKCNRLMVIQKDGSSNLSTVSTFCIHGICNKFLEEAGENRLSPQGSGFQTTQEP